jgi:parvulin-like peptidyl-prolyl isomerase
MPGQFLLRWAFIIVGLTAAGCESVPSVRAAVPGLGPEAFVMSAPEPPVVRLQKEDGDRPPVKEKESHPASVTTNTTLQGQKVAVIRANVNGAPILESEVREAALGADRKLVTLVGLEREREERKILDYVLDQIIERELIYQEALAKLKKAGKKDIIEKLKEAAEKEFKQWVRNVKAAFHSDDEFKRWLQNMNTSLEGQRRIRERVFIAEEYLRSNLMTFVDRATKPSDLMDYYKAHPEEFTRPDSVHWQDIFILASKYPSREEARRFAESVAAQARQGEDFVALCRKYDDGTSADQQAVGKGSRRGEIRPFEVENYLFQMTNGQIGPIVELREGFHIIRLVQREQAGLRPFDARVEEAVRDKIRNEVYAREKKRFVEELKKKSHVEKFPWQESR